MTLAFGDFCADVVRKLRAGDKNTTGVLVAAMLILVIPFDLSQLVFMLVGAVAYMLLQATRVPIESVGARAARKIAATGQKNCALASPPSMGACDRKSAALRRRSAPLLHSSAVGVKATSAARRAPAAPAVTAAANNFPGTPCGGEFRQPSTMPVQKPTFKAEGWVEEVRELLGRITPTKESDAAVQRLAANVRRVINRSVPEAEVFGFASSEITRASAFSVAVPEVDIIVNVDPAAIARFMGRSGCAEWDARKLQKAALRAFTDQLVSDGGFKFRRSAFRGNEPKTTLLASGAADKPIPIDFSVNVSTPLYNAALLMECGQLDARAKELVLLVKRWAKDRGIAHASKGHLSPYAWTLLTVYFLQVGLPASAGGPLLPPLRGLRRASALASGAKLGGGASAEDATAAGGNASEAQAALTTADLFKQFLHFYAKSFDWAKEAVSIRAGQRGPPDLALPLHIIINDDGKTSEVGPSIEDPFERRNLGEGTTSASLARLREELARAEEICARDDASASLAALLEPWAPPEREEAQEGSGSN